VPFRNDPLQIGYDFHECAFMDGNSVVVGKPQTEPKPFPFGTVPNSDFHAAERSKTVPIFVPTPRAFPRIAVHLG
jgi:hypothetical protein